jgi:hypothetical protein
MEISFIVSGERSTVNEKICNRKSGFFDAILLSKVSSCSPPMKSNSQLIHSEKSCYSINLKEKSSKYMCAERMLELIDEGRNLSEEEAYEIFSHFTYVEDRRVSYLLLNDKRKIKQRKTQELHQLKEEIKI